MSMRISKLVQYIHIADTGVDWHQKKGASCPVCGRRLRVVSTRGGIRYCKCPNAECPMAILNQNIKAV